MEIWALNEFKTVEGNNLEALATHFFCLSFSVGFLPVRMQSLLSVTLGSMAALKGRVESWNEQKSWYMCANATQNIWNLGS